MNAGAVVARKPGGPEVLEWVQLAVDTPGPGEVLIRQEAAGLNFIDTYYRSGLYPWPGEMLVPGAEAAGTIVAIGPGVEDFSVGQRVAYLERTGRQFWFMPPPVAWDCCSVSGFRDWGRARSEPRVRRKRPSWPVLMAMTL